MKYILSRNRFIKEAKIKDLVFTKQANVISQLWGEKYLDYEEIIPTEKIRQGKWKLDNDDKTKILNKFFETDINEVQSILSKLPEHFSKILAESISISKISNNLLASKCEIILKNFDIRNPTIDQIIVVYDNIFRKLNLNETKGDSMISKDENDKPLKDKNDQIIKISKNPGDPVFTNNLVNINSFISDYIRCYSDITIDEYTFRKGVIESIRNLIMEDFEKDYVIDYEIFNKDVYLSISHNPKDILNMSISKYYSSCQHLYGGGYRERVLSNVLDPNSIPAFLVFETPIFWGEEKISDQLPLSRMMIRSIESFDAKVDENNIYFDRCYPDRLKDAFSEIIEKYSDNRQMRDDKGKTIRPQYYYFTPDINIDDDKNGVVSDPYMDSLTVKKGSYIGVNTKKLYLNKSYDWSTTKIAKNSKIEELIIETTDLPENIFKINFNLNWVKFKFIDIKDFSVFDKLKSNSIAFDKCKLTNDVLLKVKEFNPGLNKLQLSNCDISKINLKIFENLNELQLIYTLPSGILLSNIVNELNMKKLVISGDLLGDKSNKEYVNLLKRKGIKVEIIGLVI